MRLRARRMKLEQSPVHLAAATSVRDIVASMEDPSNKIDLVVIDSIQTMYVDTVESAPGQGATFALWLNAAPQLV